MICRPASGICITAGMPCSSTIRMGRSRCRAQERRPPTMLVPPGTRPTAFCPVPSSRLPTSSDTWMPGACAMASRRPSWRSGRSQGHRGENSRQLRRDAPALIRAGLGHGPLALVRPAWNSFGCAATTRLGRDAQPGATRADPDAAAAVAQGFLRPSGSDRAWVAQSWARSPPSCCQNSVSAPLMRSAAFSRCRCTAARASSGSWCRIAS